MRNFTFVITVLTFLRAPGAFAQQDPQVSNYMFNVMEFNPAYAGSENMLSAILQARTQWDGINGNPFTGFAGVHLPLATINSGIGIEVTGDQAGQFSTFGGHLNYAYMFKLSRKAVLSIGAQGGVMQESLNGADLRAPQGVYTGGIINHNDPILPDGVYSSTAPDAGLGLFFHSQRLAIGLSVQHILPTNFLFSGPSGGAEVSLTQTYYGYASYYIPISKTLTLRPCVLVKADSTHEQVDGDLLLMYKDLFYVGAGYRGYSSNTQDAGIILVGVKLSANWFLGYSYDLTLSGLSSYESGTHEFYLKYTYSLVRAPKVGKFINTPRFN